MALSFPASPTNGQLFIPTHALGSGPIYTYNSSLAAWTRKAGTALQKNFLVNPAMQVSQQWGDTVLTGNGSANEPLADQWEYLQNPGGAINARRIAITTPRGSKYRLRMTTITTATSWSLTFWQKIEGTRIPDLAYGTANAKCSILRFGIRAPAGTYTATLRGYSNSAAYAIPFTVPDMVDTEFSFAIPPCTTFNPWHAGNDIGARLMIPTGRGTGTVVPTPLVWTGTNFYSLAGQTEFIACPTGSTFDLFDVGWHPDPNATGVAPEFIAPHYEDDLQDAQRYWYRMYGARGSIASNTVAYATGIHPVPMRAAPAATVIGTIRMHDISYANNVTSMSHFWSDPTVYYLGTNDAGPHIGGRTAQLLVDGRTTGYVAMSARM